MNRWHMRSTHGRMRVDVTGIATTFRLSEQSVIAMLEERRIKHIPDADPVRIAESFVGKAQWKLAARAEDIPNFFDCSSLTQYASGMCGIAIPRLARDQFEYCTAHGAFSGDVYNPIRVHPGSLVFSSSPFKGGKPDDSYNGYHVCIDAGNRFLITATKSGLGEGVVRLTYDTLIKQRKIIGIYRPHREIRPHMVFEVPDDRGIQFPEELYSRIRLALEKKKEV